MLLKNEKEKETMAQIFCSTRRLVEDFLLDVYLVEIFY